MTALTETMLSWVDNMAWSLRKGGLLTAES